MLPRRCSATCINIDARNLDLCFPIPYEGPFLWTGYQSGTNRVHSDVVGFLTGTFQAAQAMIKVTVLPLDMGLGC